MHVSIGTSASLDLLNGILGKLWLFAATMSSKGQFLLHWTKHHSSSLSNVTTYHEYISLEELLMFFMHFTWLQCYPWFCMISHYLNFIWDHTSNGPVVHVGQIRGWGAIIVVKDSNISDDLKLRWERRMSWANHEKQWVLTFIVDLTGLLECFLWESHICGMLSSLSWICMAVRTTHS